MKANGDDEKIPPAHDVEVNSLRASNDLDNSQLPWKEEFSYWEVNLDDILQLKISDVSEYCERVLDLDEFSDAPDLRKWLCEYLEIGQSTLSGWLTERRMPRMAKVAYVLAKALVILQNEVKRRAQTHESRIVIVGDRERYQLVRFEKDDTGALIGNVLARDIPNENIARTLASAEKALAMLEGLRANYQDELYDADPVGFPEADYRLLQDLLTARGFDEWERRFVQEPHAGSDRDRDATWQAAAKELPTRALAKLVSQPEVQALRFRKIGRELSAMHDSLRPNYQECLNRVIEFVKKPDVGGYYIGMTGPDLRGRINGYDHQYAGRRQVWAIAEELDEKGALDLEEYLCLAVRDRKFLTTPVHSKYDNKDKPHFRIPGGAKTSAPHEKVHQVYLAWRDKSLPKDWRWAGNQEFLKAIKTRDDGKATVYVARTDADFLGALASRDNFFLSMRIKLHFHTKDCRKGLPPNATNYTKLGTKATSSSFVALYQWAQQNRPARLADETQWHICDCCKNLFVG
jgi:hypothetical protein